MADDEGGRRYADLHCYPTALADTETSVQFISPAGDPLGEPLGLPFRLYMDDPTPDDPAEGRAGRSVGRCWVSDSLFLLVYSDEPTARAFLRPLVIPQEAWERGRRRDVVQVEIGTAFRSRGGDTPRLYGLMGRKTPLGRPGGEGIARAGGRVVPRLARDYLRYGPFASKPPRPLLGVPEAPTGTPRTEGDEYRFVNEHGRFVIREGSVATVEWESIRRGPLALLSPRRRNRARMRIDQIVAGGEDGGHWFVGIPEGTDARVRVSILDVLALGS